MNKSSKWSERDSTQGSLAVSSLETQQSSRLFTVKDTATFIYITCNCWNSGNGIDENLDRDHLRPCHLLVTKVRL